MLKIKWKYEDAVEIQRWSLLLARGVLHVFIRNNSIDEPHVLRISSQNHSLFFCKNKSLLLTKKLNQKQPKTHYLDDFGVKYELDLFFCVIFIFIFKIKLNYFSYCNLKFHLNSFYFNCHGKISHFSLSLFSN